MTDYSRWIGNTEVRDDIISSALVKRFQTTLDTPHIEGVPQGLHWCVCLPETPTDSLGADGHPPKGGFLPAIELPRRMWAASNVEFIRPIEENARIERHSKVANITEKSGKSGELVFVEVDHLIIANATEAIKERQTIVYRGATTTKAPLPPLAPEGQDQADLSAWDWSRTVTPKTTLLFRYSALTFNAHRIHYDRQYAEQEELYPALVVHGPLMATLLLDHCARKFGANALATFSYKGVSPAFDGQPLHLVGRGSEDLELQVIGADGRTVVKATATRNTS